jgi:hypothetical protein
MHPSAHTKNTQLVVEIRRWQHSKGSGNKADEEDPGSAGDPMVLFFKAMAVSSFIYCAWKIYPAAGGVMLDSGLSLMRTGKPIFANTGLARVRSELKTAKTAEKAFIDDLKNHPNDNAAALVRCLESDDSDIREEALKLAVAIRDLGCACSVLSRINAQHALQNVLAQHGDSRAKDLLTSIEACTSRA